MRPQTRTTLFNTYIGMDENDPRLTAVDEVLESNAGRAAVDALSVALTDGNSRLDDYRNYANREVEDGQAHLLAAELVLAEATMIAFRKGSEAVLGGEIDG